MLEVRNGGRGGACKELPVKEADRWRDRPGLPGLEQHRVGARGAAGGLSERPRQRDSKRGDDFTCGGQRRDRKGSQKGIQKRESAGWGAGGDEGQGRLIKKFQGEATV